MMGFWSKLSAREQVLIAGAGGLLFVLIIAVAVVRPLIGYKSEGEFRLVGAQAEYRAIAQLAATRQQTRQNTQVSEYDNDQSPRIIISTTARDMGVVVSRIQPAENGSLTLWMDGVTSSLLYGWLRSLETEYGIAPELVSLQKNDGGLLRAQVQFGGIQ